MSVGRIFAFGLIGFVVGILAACGGVIPNTAIPRHLAVRYVGALDAATPIPTVIHDRGIHVPDPAPTTPAEFDKIVAAEIKENAAIAKKADIKLQ